ncbi:hypothetical protein JCGZ_06064 [Jatropha curcas]|uniref:F-box domain-containing protein n=1 Tax=Jatropha curcas TaxID=180498 RepID=A0A067KPQ9_JATCU|nr:F-box/kelch-repeat protein At3g06240 [Jatropha curcas]XP_012073080.1 F-box/kelch-repeat protein At3g06240 [Jatropha curcas]XP_012073081.1 F-box/kelch-repeat protein At3g06240 [Jatropha curcas]XP_020535207.1 F-box/kelch-repeat protein At3g06240 [Jatropha curcas]KDP37008.1 hypothetical protein JCGZ_06064 [Jatropha curcas]
MEKAKIKKAGLLLDIPYDVLYDILLRLPVSSLIRFKAVNRYWHSLISSHGFAVEHFNIQANRVRPSPRRYGVIHVSSILQQQLPRLSLYMHRRIEEEEDSETALVEAVGVRNTLELLEDYKSTHDTRVFGSCNGLLLIGHDNVPKCFVLWNPLTGQEKRLPLNHFSDFPMNFMAGLGYDSSSDNFKVVVGVFDGDTRLTKVAVYNLKTNSWATVENTETRYEFSSNKPGITLTNGAPHWMLRHGDTGGLVNILVYFDLVEENFKELPLPDALVSRKNIFLSSCKGFLCVGGYSYVSSKSYTIWIMNEYGVKESWTILMEIPDIRPCYQILTFQHLMSLRIPKKSKALILLDWNSVAKYSSLGSKGTAVSFSGDQEGLMVAAFVESLISPNSFG